MYSHRVGYEKSTLATLRCKETALEGLHPSSAREIRPRTHKATHALIVCSATLALQACTREGQPSAPASGTNVANLAAQSSDDYARFEADIVTTMFIDSTGMELSGRLSDSEPARLNAFRQAARRPLVAAYHFTYVDSAGSIAVVLSPPSEAVTRNGAPVTFVQWDKVSEIRLTAGSALPQITMRNGKVLSAEIPRDFAAGVGQSAQARAPSRVGVSPEMHGEQLRSLLNQVLRRTPSTPESRRTAATRDSLRLSAGYSRRWERLNENLEFVSLREIQRAIKGGQSVQRLVVEVRNPVVAGSVNRLAREE